MNHLLKKFAHGKAKAISTSKNAVIYTRVSTKEQFENNNSIERQKKYCTEFGVNKGFEIVKYFGGTYESAKSDGRKEFDRLLKFVRDKKNKINFIIVYSWDRFSRTGGHAINIITDLMDMGIQVTSVTQQFDGTPTSGIMRDIQLIFSRADNENRKYNTIIGIREQLLKGINMMPIPIGYVKAFVDGKKVLVLDKNAHLIKSPLCGRLMMTYQ